MVKKKMLHCIMSLSFVLTLTIGGNSAHVIAAENARTVEYENGTYVETYPEEDSPEVEVLQSGENEKTKLDTPTNLRWGENWSGEWDGVQDAQGHYYLELYKDGEVIYSCGYSGWSENIVSVWLSDEIEESGTYKFRVMAMNEYDKDHFENSDWSDFSEERVYIRPDKALGTTVAHWDKETPGRIYFENVDKAGGYYIRLYKENEDGEKRCIYGTCSISSTYTFEAGTEGTENLSATIERYGEGRYYVTIKALSGNIDEIANGVVGEFSDVLDTNINAAKVSERISKAVEEATTTEEAVNTIKADNSLKELALAMQTNENTLNQIEQLEKDYIREKGIAVQVNVQNDSKSIIDQKEVSMVGAGMNAEAGNITLDISQPAKKEYVSSQHYANSVQLDIKLLHDNEKIHALTMPVTVTMPIPDGIDISRLVILHYKEDGTFETVNLKTNGDGTVTFTVTHFSTFVFAQNTVDVSTVFRDVKSTDWWYSAVQYAYANGLMTGKSADTFDPAGKLTRDQFVQVLYSHSGKPNTTAANKFPDVKEDGWYRNAVLWANEKGVVAGNGDGTFGVGKDISREALALMLYKYAGLNNYNLNSDQGVIEQFADGAKVSTWAQEALDWAVTQGIMSGKGTGGDLSTYKLDPQGSATRAECAAMMRMLLTNNE